MKSSRTASTISKVFIWQALFIFSSVCLLFKSICLSNFLLGFQSRSSSHTLLIPSILWIQSQSWTSSRTSSRSLNQTLSWTWSRTRANIRRFALNYTVFTQIVGTLPFVDFHSLPSLHYHPVLDRFVCFGRENRLPGTFTSHYPCWFYPTTKLINLINRCTRLIRRSLTFTLSVGAHRLSWRVFTNN